MKMVEDLLVYLQSLDKKKFEQLLYMTLAGSFLILGLEVYIFYQQNNSLITHISSIKKLSRTISEDMERYGLIQQERTRVQETFEKEKDFDIKSFLEDFCKEQNVKPESSWKPEASPIEGSEQFEELSLLATFNGQTTDKLVAFLEALSQKPMVFVKELNIKKGEKGKTITYELTIATVTKKQSAQE